MPENVSPPPTGVTDSRPGQSEDQHTTDRGALRGRVGVLELVLTVLAFSAPMVVVSGVTPFVIIFGGAGAPVAFAIVTVLLLVFAVGYTTMTRYLPNPGAFYAYITAGLGRVLGLGASFLALFAYLVLGVGTYVFFAVVAKGLVEGVLMGPVLPWYLYALACAALTGLLGYLRIDLSVKTLSIVMVCEILIVMIFDVAVLGDGGPGGRTLEPFTWGAFNSGAVGLALLFAATCFLGFEATAVFREEVKDPRRTIPRATYLAVLCIGIFYVLAAWLLIVAYGTADVSEVAGTNFAGMFSEAIQSYVGTWASHVVTVLVVTSAFAAVLSVQNILARYVYSLGVDRVLPPALSTVHPRHGSPSVSSVTVTAVKVLILLVLAVAADDTAAVYGQFGGTGGFAVLVLMFLTSVSVVVFFWRRRDIVDVSLWHRFIAPALGAIGLGAVLWLAVTNFTTMTGGSMAVAVGFQVAVWAVFLAGVVLALVYRSRRPDVYARIGRQEVS
ncbi:APC family permease [Streptomyces qaidamensis]|uniref:APC family permease n=1 Tax=Streptomyces qaidamensis TaxID=1783515 RepID=UPI00365C2BB4